MKRSNAIIIILLMVGGTLATATYYTRFTTPDCGQPPTGGTPTLLGKVALTSVNGQAFWQQNVTFTAAGQQVVIGRVAFRTSSFFDPSLLHLKANACVTEPNAPFQMLLTVDFNDMTTLQALSFSYGGNPPTAPVTLMTGHSNPQAGVRWLPGQSYISLLLSTG